MGRLEVGKLIMLFDELKLKGWFVLVFVRCRLIMMLLLVEV